MNLTAGVRTLRLVQKEDDLFILGMPSFEMLSVSFREGSFLLPKSQGFGPVSERKSPTPANVLGVFGRLGY